MIKKRAFVEKYENGDDEYWRPTWFMYLPKRMIGTLQDIPHTLKAGIVTLPYK